MDGYGVDGQGFESCLQPPDTTTEAGDCDDNNPNINPGAEEIPNNDIDENCDENIVIIDEDGDGFNSDDDCDDTDPNVYPGAPELCDSTDNNCDGSVDEGVTLTTYYVDADMDGYGDSDNFSEECNQPPGTSIQGGDCDDTDPNINPDAEEIPNNDIDENCDGESIQTYYDFLQIGWRQGFEQRLGDGGGGISSSINNHYITQDSIVAGVVYKFVIFEGFNSTGQLLRFDNGKIYRRWNNLEDLFFDFTASVGDTINDLGQPNLPSYIVESSEFTELLNGQEVRRLGLRRTFEPAGNITDYWLEGVGYEDSGLLNSTDFEDGGTFHICTSQDDTILFDESIIENVDCEYIIGSYTVDADDDGFFLAEDCNDTNPDINPDAEDIPNNGIDENCDGEDTISSTAEPITFTYSIYPNPVINNLFINIESDQSISIQVFDVNGKLLMSSMSSNNSTSIEMTDFNSGVYFIKLENKAEVVCIPIVKL